MSFAEEIAECLEDAADDIYGIYSCVPGREHWWVHEKLMEMAKELRRDPARD